MSSGHAANILSSDSQIIISLPHSQKSPPSTTATQSEIHHLSSPTPQDSRDPRQRSDDLDGRRSDPEKMFDSGLAQTSNLASLEAVLPTDEDEPNSVIVINGNENGAHLNNPSSSSLDQPQNPPMAVSSNVDDQQWNEEDSHELKRVKVYELIGARWVDQGTAFCFGDFQDNEALLIARAEADFNHVILTTTIRSTDVYQRQQDTLIVWTEPDGVDYALSFQDPDGCAEVWNFIQEVQRHMNATESGLSSSPVLGEPSITTASIIRSGHLPTPGLGIMGEIEKAIKTITRQPPLKERVCEYIQNEDYIKAMIDVMAQAEDLESIDNLHALCSCMQTILMLNDHSLYEHILEDDIFIGVVGMLEYDPDFPTYKANYRDFLRTTSKFHQPIPLRDASIQKKVHHIYRLQFLKDVVLARAIDDSTFNVLNSCIIFNQIDIINHIQNDAAFLKEVVGLFIDDGVAREYVRLVQEGERVKDMGNGNKMDVDLPEGSKPNGPSEASTSSLSTSVSSLPNGSSAPLDPLLVRRQDVVNLIQQLCVMGKNVQLPARMQLFRVLTDCGIPFVIQWALGQEEGEESGKGKEMISVGGEILMTLLDHDLDGVRAHIVKQLERELIPPGPGLKSVMEKGKEKETLSMLMCQLVVKSKDLAIQSQIGETLKMLLEVTPPDVEPHPMVGAKMLQRRDDPATEKFLDYFYKQCVDVLFEPILDLPESRSLSEPIVILSRARTNLYLNLCELLSNFALQHYFRSHFYILSSNIATRVASLLSAKDKHLRLAAFRFFRVLLRLNNRNLFNHIIKHDLLKPVLDLTLKESRRDNLLSSTCQEFFEHMRKENLKELIHNCMTKHADVIKALSDTQLGGPRFKAFIGRWEMNVEPLPKEDEKIVKPPSNGVRRWGQGRLLEIEEEDYFNADDDEDEILPVVNSPSLPRTSGHGPATNTVRRRRTRASAIPIRPSRPPLNPRAPPLGSLVDYDESDDLNVLGPIEEYPTTSPPFTPMSPGTSPTRQAAGGLASNIAAIFPGSPVPSQPLQEVQTNPRLGHHRPMSSSPKLPSPIPIPTVPSMTSATPSTSTPEDETDGILESLVFGNTGPPSPSLMQGGRPFELGLGGLKRRREDEDEEMMERLVNKSKRPSVFSKEKKGNEGVVRIGSIGSKASEEGGLGGGGGGIGDKGHHIVGGGGGGGQPGGGQGTGGGGGGPKKIKLKLASSSTSNIASSPSSTGAKDGDGG